VEAYTKRQGRSAHGLKALLVHLQTPTEFECNTHGAPGVILVGCRHPKHNEQAVAYGGMQPPPIRAPHVVSEIVQLLHQAVQGIEIKTRSTCRRAGHRAAEYRDELALSTKSSLVRRRQYGLRIRGNRNS
jgi:hypothetical protein